MTVLKTAAGLDQVQCDGCGRVNDTVNPDLGIQTYAVHDPSVGAKVRHHYCSHCALNRNANIEALTVAYPPSASAAPTSNMEPEQALANELPAPVEEAVEAAERIEQQDAQ